MKHLLLPLLAAAFALTACRGSGGPATRVGRGVDHAFYKVGYGVKKVGQKIENTAR